MNLRTRIIQKLIALNENFLFYPKLKKFYVKNLERKMPIILDVGCNKGQSINFFLQVNASSTIYAFEPNKRLYNRLIDKYQQNTAIKLYNIGVSDKNGKLTFNENILDETSTFETLNYDSIYLKKKAKILGVSTKDIIIEAYDVDVIMLSSFIKEREIPKIDVLKIDVEGHEYQCLLGLFNNATIANNIKFIQLESHTDDMYLNKKEDYEIKHLLNENGFKECQKIKHGFGGIYEIIYKNITM